MCVGYLSCLCKISHVRLNGLDNIHVTGVRNLWNAHQSIFLYMYLIICLNAIHLFLAGLFFLDIYIYIFNYIYTL